MAQTPNDAQTPQPGLEPGPGNKMRVAAVGDLHVGETSERAYRDLFERVADDADVLCLVEPTSAVDAHTEARIAPRLVAHRAGRTTVVATASPLILHSADEVALLAEGRVVARGSHVELLSRPDYRQVVARGMDGE